MAAVTITVVDIYLLKYFLLWFATRYRAVVKSSHMREHPKKHRYQIGKNSVIWDDQQERLVRVPNPTEELKWFISGFVDGEGSFCLNVKNHPKSKNGFRIDPAFYVYQHEKNRWILEVIKEVFNHGSIHRKTSPYSVYTYQIAGIKPCYDIVMPFFSKYCLATKQETFKLFSEGVSLMYNKEHLKREGMIELVDIAYNINLLGKGKKWDKEEILARILRD